MQDRRTMPIGPLPTTSTGMATLSILFRWIAALRATARLGCLPSIPEDSSARSTANTYTSMAVVEPGLI